MGGVPSTGTGTAGQHVGDRGNRGKGGWRPREQRTRRGVQEDSPLPTAVARVRSEVPGCYERSRGLRGEGTH